MTTSGLWPLSAPSPTTISPPYSLIYRLLKEKAIIPFFGSGASASSGVATVRQLITKLSELSMFPDDIEPTLQNVVMYFEHVAGRRFLNEYLRELFSTADEPQLIHRLLISHRPKVIITTNYDTLLEKACFISGIRHRVVVTDLHEGLYMYNDGSSPGWTKHRRFPVEDFVEDTIVIYKIHGNIDRVDPSHDYYLISEDDYYNAVIATDNRRMFPDIIRQFTKNTPQTLFIGYSMSDFHIYHFYRRLAHEQNAANRRNRYYVNGSRDKRTFAICLRPTRLCVLKYDVIGGDVYDISADEFAYELDRHMVNAG